MKATVCEGFASNVKVLHSQSWRVNFVSFKGNEQWQEKRQKALHLDSKMSTRPLRRYIMPYFCNVNVNMLLPMC